MEFGTDPREVSPWERAALVSMEGIDSVLARNGMSRPGQTLEPDRDPASAEPALEPEPADDEDLELADDELIQLVPDDESDGLFPLNQPVQGEDRERASTGRHAAAGGTSTGVGNSKGGNNANGRSSGNNGNRGNQDQAAGIPQDAAIGAVVAETAVATAELQGLDHGPDPLVEHEQAPWVQPLTLRPTDHQEAVNQAAWGSGGSSRQNGSVRLPEVKGFAVPSAASQPVVRSLPEVLVNAMRQQVSTSAVRELGVSRAEASDFASRLSQGSLVLALLLSQLDVALETDEATACAAWLFRAAHPLMGRLAERLAAVEAGLADDLAQAEVLAKSLRSVQTSMAVVEQGLAYSIADRSVSFLRDVNYATGQEPITDKRAVALRDRMRAQTMEQLAVEAERAGRVY